MLVVVVAAAPPGATEEVDASAVARKDEDEEELVPVVVVLLVEDNREVGLVAFEGGLSGPFCFTILNALEEAGVEKNVLAPSSRSSPTSSRGPSPSLVINQKKSTRRTRGFSYEACFS